MSEELVEVVRSVILNALHDCPQLLPQDRRYADHGGQQIAKSLVAHRIARELSAYGYLPFDPTYVRLNLANFSAVSFTMGQMRTRLLKHIKGGGRDPDAERDAMDSAAVAFFTHLEERGWRLVQSRAPLTMGEHFEATGFNGRTRSSEP